MKIIMISLLGMMLAYCGVEQTEDRSNEQEIGERDSAFDLKNTSACRTNLGDQLRAYRNSRTGATCTFAYRLTSGASKKSHTSATTWGQCVNDGKRMESRANVQTVFWISATTKSNKRYTCR